MDFPSPLTGFFWPSPGGSTGQLLKTTDGGASWYPLSYTGGNIFVLRFYNNNIGLICAGAQKIWRTIDGGTSWESFVSPFPPNEWGAEDICFDPSNPSRVWMSRNIMYKSDDTGRTWISVPFPDTGKVLTRDIVLTGSLNGWVLCDRSIYKTINGADWLRVENVPAEFDGVGYALDAVPGNAAVFSTNRKTFKTTDGGARWVKISERVSDDDGTITVKDDTHFWSGTWEGRIYNTTDGGTTWKQQYWDTTKTRFFNYIKFFDLSNGIAMGDPIYDSSLKPISPTLFLYTTDGGTTWTQRIPKLKN
jgi:photosystem II stability/assembly factor-like uncharacterized protein